MNRQHWTRIGALPVALLLGVTTTSCGSAASTATNKRLGTQGPCELAKIEDLEKIFGPVNKNVRPNQEGQQCFYLFENGNLAIGRSTGAMKNTTPTDINGVPANKAENERGFCAIEVWLVPGDMNQQFNVSGEASGKTECDVARTVSQLILNNLPG